MGPLPTLGAYAAGLAVVFTAALGVGSAVGPVGAVAEPAAHGDDHGATTAASAEVDAPGGLAVAAEGYALELATPVLQPGATADLRFVVRGPDGAPLTAYDRTHEQDLHLVLVRRDGTQFSHVHPERDAAGTWSIPVTPGVPGAYKVFADFDPAGDDEGLVLAADLTVPGPAVPVVLPAEARTATVDGYVVELEGDLTAGSASPVSFTVTRDGRPVEDLEPYLGAYGHLVALRGGDLAYLHVHPEDEAAGGPVLRFVAEVPTASPYRLFLDFQHDGQVRTASFSLPAGASGGAADAPHDH